MPRKCSTLHELAAVVIISVVSALGGDNRNEDFSGELGRASASGEVALARGEQTKRAAMNWDSLHPKDRETVPREQWLQRGEAEIEDVLVVNRVEFNVLQHLAEVRHFEHRHFSRRSVI